MAVYLRGPGEHTQQGWRRIFCVRQLGEVLIRYKRYRWMGGVSLWRHLRRAALGWRFSCLCCLPEVRSSTGGWSGCRELCEMSFTRDCFPMGLLRCKGSWRCTWATTTTKDLTWPWVAWHLWSTWLCYGQVVPSDRLYRFDSPAMPHYND